MEINLSDVFDDIDTQQISKIPEASLNTEQMKDIKKRVAEKTMSKLKLESKLKRLRFPIKRFLAVACAIVITACGTTVGAANYFKPDNAINRMLELNSKVDYSTLGTDVDATASSNGLDFHIGQVLCDNSVMFVPIECPKYNGRYVSPMIFDMSDDTMKEEFHVFINGESTAIDFHCYNDSEKDNSNKQNIFYLKLKNLKNIKNNSQIKFTFSRLEYFDAEEENDICDVEGNWEFNFTVNRSNTRQKLKVNDLVFENGERYVAKEFTISPLGFTYDFNIKYEEPTGEYEGTELKLPKRMPKALEGSSIIFSEHLARHLQGTAYVTIEMKDGTIYTDNSEQNDIESNCSTSDDTILKKTSGNVNATFNSAIDVENIKSITILDKVIYEQ